MIATDFVGLSLLSLQQGLLGWKRNGGAEPSKEEVFWRLPDCSLVDTEADEMIRYFFAAGALEGSEDSMHPTNTQQGDLALQMVRDGVAIATMPGRYQLTTAATRKIVASQKVQSSPVLVVRQHIPIADRTEYELCQMLVDAGWVWRIMPRNVKDRIDLIYRPGSDKQWYTLSNFRL